MEVSDGIQSDVGVIGLDAIGRNVVLHLSERELNVTAMAWGQSAAQTLEEEITGSMVRVAANVSDFTSSLRQPRTILLFAHDNDPLNQLLERILPHLAEGDVVMDARDSLFKETAKIGRHLAERGVHFLGIGIAGGEKGAREGAVIIAGGGHEAIQRIRPLLESLAASVREDPCVHYCEKAAAAHFIKMAHAGVEFALLQLLGEIFDLLKHSLLLTDEELDDASASWHIGVLNGYLEEISGRIAAPGDHQTPRRWLEQQLESLRNNGPGLWAAQSAWELEVAVPTIEAAAGIRRVTPVEKQESLMEAPFRQPVGRFGDDPESVLEEIHEAFQAAMIITYAQATALLAAASKEFGFQFQLHEIWRSLKGCARLRAALLDDISSALQTTPDLPDLLADDDLSERVMACQEKLRHAVWRAHELNLPAPALLASLDYLDSNKAAWLPVNLIQVPRRPFARAALQTNRAF